jgi:DNA invertase Pin-like site-specific DNA recombinase
MKKSYTVAILTTIFLFNASPRVGSPLKMLLTIFAGIAQFERDLTSERTKEGILAARKRGKLLGGPKADEEKIQYALYLMKQGLSRTDAAENAGISRMTLYRKLQKDN